MSITHVFKQLNQELVALFDRAGSPDEVVVVPIDYAKHSHAALICDGLGRQLKAPFEVYNTPEGVAFLQREILAVCRAHGHDPRHVVVGGEDCGSFSLNFVQALARSGLLVIGVDARAAKDRRENLQASTDTLDLLGICQLLLDRRGTTRSRPIEAERVLRNLTRHRDTLVRTKTAQRNRIHSLVDELFPGFLDERKSGVSPFSPASLWLMSDRFSCAHIRRRRPQVLLREFTRLGVKQPDDVVARLRHHAHEVIDPPPPLVATLQHSLRHEIQLYQGLLGCIDQVDTELARLLAATPGALVTTIKGIGCTLAACTTAEIGPLHLQPSLRRLSSYAGIVPRIKQTGGPLQPASASTVSRRCNHILKNYLVQAGCHMGLHGPDDLLEDHRRRTANGQHADFGLARRVLRTAVCLMRYNQVYLPPRLRGRDASPDDRRTYYLEQWPTWRKKWLAAGALEHALHPDNPLGMWRNCIQELYDIKLPR